MQILGMNALEEIEVKSVGVVVITLKLFSCLDHLWLAFRSETLSFSGLFRQE